MLPTQKIQKIVEILQVQFEDEVVDVPVTVRLETRAQAMLSRGRTATQLDPYTSGVLSQHTCKNQTTTTCGLVFGFDTAASNPYQKVKNSLRQIGAMLGASDLLMA